MTVDPIPPVAQNGHSVRRLLYHPAVGCDASTVRTYNDDIWDEVRAERIRAHEKHGETSMDRADPFDLLRLSILLEEVGEVAKVLNDARHEAARLRPDSAGWFLTARRDLRTELIQVAAMAGAWADAL